MPAAAEMQVCTRTLSPSTAVVIEPSRRSRTAPSVIGSTQLKQMPIRQPDGISTPAASPASSSGVLPMTEGAVRDLRDGSITTAVEGDNVLVQTCVSAAAGNCHLDH